MVVGSQLARFCRALDTEIWAHICIRVHTSYVPRLALMEIAHFLQIKAWVCDKYFANLKVDFPCVRSKYTTELLLKGLILAALS